MYTDLRHAAIGESIKVNLARAQEPGNASANGGVRSSTRVRNSVCCPKGKCKQRECWFGKRVFDDSDHVEVTFDDIVDINKFAEENSFMFVGNQLRKYELGVPMGDPLSCAAALSCTMAAEMTADRKRRTKHGDARRNLSLCFMDDLFFRIAYDPDAHKRATSSRTATWTKESAKEYVRELMACYPKPLELE